MRRCKASERGEKDGRETLGVKGKYAGGNDKTSREDE